MRTPLCLVGLFLMFGGAAIPSAAQSTSNSLRAHEVDGPARIQLDGHLDEAAWAAASTSTDFTQQEPVEGAPPSERTAVRAVVGDEALYLGITLFYEDPSDIRAYQLRRDIGLGSDDRLMWTIDPYNDGRNAYFFETNPLGVRGDGLLSTGQGSNLNKDWDGIWDVAVRRHDEGWTAEIRLPFRTLQFDPAQTTWGFNVQRTIRVENEEILWAGFKRNQGIFRPRYAGELRGVQAQTSGLGLDVTPFGLASGTRTWSETGSSDDTVLDAGGDLSYAFTPGLRTAFTVNTDFAEVEVDQRRVNLTRFPLFFPEKRDFFLESADLFQFAPSSGQNPFFSRRIGLVDGSPVPILAGGRLNGRFGSYNVGLFQVRTRAKDGVGVGGSELPPEDFTAGRVVRNLGPESQLGAIYTRRATHDRGGPYALLSTRHTLGADLELGTTSLFGDKDFQFQAFALWHNAPLENPGALDATDDTLGVDEIGAPWHQRTTRGVRFNYPNDPWIGQLSYREFGTAYDPAVGFVQRVGFRRFQPTIEYEPVLEDHPYVQTLGFTVRYEYLTDLAVEPQTINLTLTPVDVEFVTGDGVEAAGAYDFEQLNAPFDILRDGSIVIPPGEYRTYTVETEAETAGYRRLSTEGSVEYGGFWSGTQTEFEVGTTVRPLTGVNLGLDWEHNRVRLAEGDFNTHVFRFDGNLDLSPNLSFTSQLQYDNLSERLGLFTRLRWILEPGSDLFFVYTHNWQSTSLDRDRLSPRNAEAALKLTYTIRI
jgi:hypothetical protein